MKTFLALYMGDLNAAPVQPSPEAIAKGMAAWDGWMTKHADAVVETGGPLGKTKKASRAGVEDITNAVSGYVVVRAESHEAAARMFEAHPHFRIFPGDSVEVMEVLPIPTA